MVAEAAAAVGVADAAEAAGAAVCHGAVSYTHLPPGFARVEVVGMPTMAQLGLMSGGEAVHQHEYP